MVHAKVEVTYAAGTLPCITDHLENVCSIVWHPLHLVSFCSKVDSTTPDIIVSYNTDFVIKTVVTMEPGGASNINLWLSPEEQTGEKNAQ